MKPRNSGRPRNLSGTDRVLWDHVKKSIKPLREKTAEMLPEDFAPEEPPIRKKSSKPIAPRVVPAPSKTQSYPPLVPIERRVKQRVARGSIPIDARIDLHGRTQREAHHALLGFLHRAQDNEATLVLVITGKGSAGDGERGVLKRQVPMWLAQPEFRAYVVGFESAHVSHGGEGALYIRMRKRRNR
jgi:DNA-nicking Smr family endonuclease